MSKQAQHGPTVKKLEALLAQRTESLAHRRIVVDRMSKRIAVIAKRLSLLKKGGR